MTEDNLSDMVDEVVEEHPARVDENKPRCTDKDWVEFVLDQLADHELVDGLPTTDGLRRVCEDVFGTILVSDSIPVSFCHESNEAVVKHLLEIYRWDIGQKIIASAVVNVKGDKLPYPFSDHPEATACTRAEGKALRRALKIRVQTAEEISNIDDEIVSVDDPATDQQIVAIKTLCKRNNVNVEKFVKANVKSASKMSDIKNLEGRTMINTLSGYQREGVPKPVLGYKDNWEESFGG